MSFLEIAYSKYRSNPEVEWSEEERTQFELFLLENRYITTKDEAIALNNLCDQKLAEEIFKHIKK